MADPSSRDDRPPVRSRVLGGTRGGGELADDVAAVIDLLLGALDGSAAAGDGSAGAGPAGR